MRNSTDISSQSGPAKRPIGSTSQCQCGDGEVFDKLKREKERSRSEKRHRQMVDHELAKDKRKEVFDKQKREEKRSRSEKRHHQLVDQELAKERGKEKKNDLEKPRRGSDKGKKVEESPNESIETFESYEASYEANKEPKRNKKNEDRIINGYDVSHLARPWHANIITTTKK